MNIPNDTLICVLLDEKDSRFNNDIVEAIVAHAGLMELYHFRQVVMEALEKIIPDGYNLCEDCQFKGGSSK